MSSFKDLVAGDQPVLIDFSAEWCGPCKMLHPILEQASKELGDEVRIVKIDVDRNPALAQQLRIQGVPTLMLYKAGQVVWRQSGVVPLAQLVQTIRSYTASV